MAVAENDRYTEAQARVAADALAYEKTATIDVGTDGRATFPADLVTLTGLYDGSSEIEPLLLSDYLELVSGQDVANYTGLPAYVVIGRELRALPLGARTLTMFYWARTPAYDGLSFTLTGPTLALVEHLKQAGELIDRGEPEIGAWELGRYEIESRRLRRRHRQSEYGDSLVVGPLR